jgi:glutathione S-transferase
VKMRLSLASPFVRKVTIAAAMKGVREQIERVAANKIDDALNLLNEQAPTYDGAPDIGHIPIACAPGHLDFRHDGKWLAQAPALVSWLERFSAAVPSFAASTPTD